MPASYDAGTGIWTVGGLSNGGSASLTIVATVTAPGTITNTALVAGNQYDPNAANNSASTGTAQLVDLVVTKTVEVAAINVGSVASFTVTVANSGPGTAHNVVVSDPLPASLTFVSDTPSAGSYDPATGDWTIGTVGNGGSATLTLHATVTSGIPATNRASVKSLDEPQSSTANDSAGATVTPPLADLQVTKTVATSRPDLGDADSFTVTVTNSGPDDATAVTVLDVLPAGPTYVSNTASQGSFDSATGIWTLGALANGASATLTMHVSVAAAGDYTNTASVTHSDQYDPNSANNQASASLSTRVADIAVAKTADHATPAVGTDVTFTVTASNGGPDDATQLVIHDPLPAGLTFVSAAPSVGTYSPTTGDWTIGPIANGANATLDLKAEVAGSGSIVNTAAVSGLLQRDPDAGNDSASASLDVPPAADLSLSKAADVGVPNLNENVTFTIKATNHGPNDTSGVRVTDVLPAGLAYVSSSPSTGTFDSASGEWAVGELRDGATAALT